MSLAEHLLGKLSTASPAAMRVELKLRHFEELSNAETAQVLGIKPSAAVNRYVRALERLKAFRGMPGGFEGI